MPRYHRARHGSTYFFTVVTHRRLPILCRPEIRRLLHHVIEELRLHRPFTIDSWVLLPDHMHCIWTLPASDTDYSARWGWLKKELTKRARGLVEPMAPPTLWQKRFWEHAIRDDNDYAAHCDYIHFNPVKHGLADRAGDWPWSTFHRFVAAGIYPEDWGGRMDMPLGVGNE